MVQILPKVASFGELMGEGLGQTFGSALAGGVKGYQEQKQNEAFKNKYGIDLSGMTPEMKQEVVKQLAKSHGQLTLLQQAFPGRFGRKMMSDQASAQVGEKLQGMESMPASEEMQNIPEGFEDMTAEDRTILAAIAPNIATQLTQEEKLKHKQKSEIAARHYDIAKDTLKSTAQKAELLPQKESALTTLEDAIKSKDMSFFSRDNLAELTGIEGLRSPQGAVFKTASKEFFLGNMSRVGAKGLNQWLERQISDMSQKIGRSTQANLIVTEALRSDLDIERKQIELTNRIADEMEKKYGYVRRDLSDQVMKELRPYAIEKQKALKKQIENIQDKYEKVNKNGFLMRDPKGDLRRVSKKDRQAAEQAGYRLEK